jgi:hypothetical protein
MANPTTNLNITLPVPESESSRGNWGDTINNALQSLDTGIADRGVPSGGADAQVLTKNGSTDYDTEWANKSAMLTFLNAEDGATADQSASEVRTLVADALDSNVYTDAEKTKLTDINSVDVTTVADNDANVTLVAGQINPTNNIGTLSSSIGNINLIAGDLSDQFSHIIDHGLITDAVSASTGTSSITTVATNIADINRYAQEYKISDTAPTSPTPTAGDLWYDGTNDTLKFHNGSGFVASSEGDISAVTAGTGLTGGGTAGSVTVNVIGGTGITANADDIAIDATVTTLSGSQTLTNKTLTSPVFNTGVSGSAIKDEDNMVSNSVSHIATQQSIKQYVDTKIATVEQVDVTGDSGTVTYYQGLSDDIGFIGGTGITTSASGTDVTFVIDTGTTVDKTTTQTLSAKTLTSPVLNTGVSGTAIKDEDNMVSNSVSHIATQQSIKQYVDGEIAIVDTLPVTADSGTAEYTSVHDALVFTGGTGITTSASGETVTFVIDSTVATLTGSQILTNKTLTSPVLVTPDLGTPSSMMLDFGTIT